MSRRKPCSAAFAAWVDGAEKPMGKPSQVIATTTTAPEGVSFGDRHMRIGWKTPLTVGTVLLRGSVIRRGARSFSIVCDGEMLYNSRNGINHEESEGPHERPGV
jgi:hypothetical protein